MRGGRRWGPRRPFSCRSEPQVLFLGLQGLDEELNVLVERDAQLIHPQQDVLPVYTPGKALVFQLLLYALDLAVVEAPGRPHQGAGDEESAQLVDREECPCHQ